MPDDFESFLRATPAPAATTQAAAAAPAITAAPAAAPSPAANDPFAEFLQADKAQNEANVLRQAQATAVSNSGSSADAAGQAARIGRQINAPQAAVEADLPRYQAQALAEKNAATVATSPKLAGWVAANPDSARVAQDDFDGMANVEPLFAPSAKKSIEPVLMGFVKGAVGDFNNASLAVNRYIGDAASGLDSIAGTKLSDWWYNNLIAPSLENKATTAIPENASFGVKAAATTGGLLSTLLQIIGSGGMSLEAKAVGAADSLGTMLAQTAKTGSRAMAFPSLVSARNVGQDVYDQTGDMKQAILAAQMAYGTTTLGGIIPLGAPGSLGARLGSGFFSGAVTGEVSRQAMNLVMPQKQGFDPEQTILAGLGGAILGGVMGPRAENRGPLNDGVRQTFAEAVSAENAERGGQMMEQLSKIAQESKLRDADPDAFKEFIRSQTEDGAVPNVYVDGKTFENALHQSGIDPEQIPGMRDRLAEATMTGGDVQIPIEDYATHIAGTQLEKAILPSLKVEEGGMTYAEGQKFYQDAAGEMQARANEIVKQQEVKTAEDAELGKIRDSLVEQLKATGRFPDDVSRASLAPVTEFYRTMAARNGMTPAEMYEQFPLKIVAESPAYGSLTQPPKEGPFGPITEAFKGDAAGAIAYLKEQKTGDAVGALYHPDIGEIDLPWGIEGQNAHDGAGLAKLVRWHPEVVDNLQEILSSMEVTKRTDNRVQLESADHKGAVRLTYDGEAKKWLLTAFEKEDGGASPRTDTAGKTGQGDSPSHTSEAIVDETLKKFYQENRGGFEPSTNTIGLMRDADLSTMIHESGHFFLTTMGDLAARPNAPAQLKADFDTFLKWAGPKEPPIAQFRRDAAYIQSTLPAPEEGFTRMWRGNRDGEEGTATTFTNDLAGIALPFRKSYDGRLTYVDVPNADVSKYEQKTGAAAAAEFNLPEELAAKAKTVDLHDEPVEKRIAAWNDLSLDQQREMHEKFARGFETYLMEGRAPTQELQPLFARFRSWLISIYRSIKSLGADLTPEVRGVMDRLLASDDAIRQAELSRSYFPLDLSKADATEKQRADYVALSDQATQDAITDLQDRSIRDLQYASNAKGRALRALQREAKGLRKGIQEEVTREVESQPIYQAESFLRRGELPEANRTNRQRRILEDANMKGTKLSLPDLKEMYGDGPAAPWRYLDTGTHGLAATDGMHPDMVAEIFGFSSGDQLVRELIAAEPRKDVIERLSDERMLQRHGELTDPVAMEAAANEAVHNAARAKFMATGLKLLAKSPVPASELARAATEAAHTAISAKLVKDINPRQYEVAETKANKEAIQQAPKDIAAAISAQRQALLSNRLAKAAHDALAEIKKIVDSQARYDKDSIRAKMDPDILEQIDALRERFDFRKAPPEGPTKQQMQLQQWIDSQKDLGYAPLQNADMLDQTIRKHYKDLTMEQLRGFHDTIRSMEAIARARKTVTVDGKKVDLANVVSDLVEKMKARGDKFTTEQLVDRPRAGADNFFKVALDRASAQMRAMSAELKPQQYKANQFDMHELMGPFTKSIFQRVFKANYDKVDMLKALSTDFKAAGERLGKDWQRSLNDFVTNTTLIDADITKSEGRPVYRRLTRGDMLGIARHVGNESNFDKLAKGMEWQPGDIWKFLHDNMTAQDWEATQKTWDAFERHWPAMVEMNKRLGNTSPDRIEPRAFRTKFGEMAGGYAPIDYDPIRSKLAVRKADSAAIDPSEGLFGRGYYRADTTTNGSLNARVANYYDRLDLDFHSVERRLHDTIHDLAYREALLDVHKILSDADFRRQFQHSFGPEQYKSLQQWIGDLANGQNRDQKLSRLGAILGASRRAIVANGIALRISTTLKHGGSAGLKSLGYFTGGGEKYFAARVAAMGTRNGTEISTAIEKFPEIRARLLQQDRDYRELTASMFQPEGWHAKAERFGHSMVAWSDMMTAVPTAWAAYDRAITEGIPVNRGGTGKPMSEKDAVAYADQIVREAHGSNIESARSMVLQNNNEAVKMMTTLYGFMNNSLGQHMDMVDKFRTAGFSKPEVLSRYMMAMIVPALWAGALEKHHGKDGEEESWVKWAAGAITGEYAGMVPFAREAWAATKGYPHAGLPAYMSVMGAASKPVIDAVKYAEGKPVKAPIKDLGNAIGLAIPGGGQIGTTLQYVADVKSGKEQPRGPLDVAKGLALGHGTKD